MNKISMVDRIVNINKLINNKGLIEGNMLTFKPIQNPRSHISILLTEENKKEVAIVSPYDDNHYIITDDLIAISLVNEYLQKFQ